MTYAEKQAQQWAAIIMHPSFSMIDAQLLFKEAIEEALQAQKELDLHIFKEALKDADIGGRQHDDIVEAVLDAEVKP